MGIGSLDLVITTLQNGVTALSNIAKTLGMSFPQVTGTSTSATVGSITFNSSQPAGFITVVSTSGTTLKIPYYNS